MKDSNTHISWPCRMKIGAKSKKGNLTKTLTSARRKKTFQDRIILKLDFINLIAPLYPHVRIIGLQETVLRAMDKVMACLDSKVRKKRLTFSCRIIKKS